MLQLAAGLLQAWGAVGIVHVGSGITNPLELLLASTQCQSCPMCQEPLLRGLVTECLLVAGMRALTTSLNLNRTSRTAYPQTSLILAETHRTPRRWANILSFHAHVLN